MDKGYSGREMRKNIQRRRWVPVVPPLRHMVHPWKYDRALYARRNEIERLFHHLKSFRRVATRYDKLDLMFRSFVSFGLILLFLRVC